MKSPISLIVLWFLTMVQIVKYLAEPGDLAAGVIGFLLGLAISSTLLWADRNDLI